MADIVGLVASVLQLVDTVAKARKYIKDFRDAPKDQLQLLLEIQNLETLLKALDDRVRDNDAARTSGMQAIEKPLIELNGTMGRLTKKLNSKGISKMSARFTWPLWGKEDVQEGLNGIERFKTLTNAWLGLDICSLMVNDLRTTLESPNTGVAVIYLNRDPQSPSSLLAGVWRQLVLRKSIPSSVHQLYETHREQGTAPSLDETYSVLRSTVSELPSAFIVVDALDEYPQEQRDTFLSRLLTLGPNVNLMLLSRPHINVASIFPSDLGILEVRANDDDMRRYIDAQVSKPSRLSKHIKTCPDLRGEIERRIISRSDGMFLLAKLNMESLGTKLTVKAVRDALKNMPGDLNSMYDEVMERINQQCDEEKHLARVTLSWISNAETVLNISELIEALAIEPGTSDLDRDNMLDMDTILSVCAGLVVVNEDLVRLIHYTAHDYLDRIQDREFPDAQTEIAEACVTYLSFQKFARAGQLDLESLLDENPLLEYARLFCLFHARGEPEHRIKDIILRFLTHLSVDCEIMHSMHTSLPRTRLGIAAYFGMLEMARHLIEEDGFDTSALRGATTNGHTDMVRLLMQSPGYHELVGRQKASQSLSNVGNVGTSAQEITSIFQTASLNGNEDRIHLLLESGVDVNADVEPYGSALQAASANGHYSVVCVLLASGANVNAQSGKYGTALRAASLAGHADVVLLLLDHGAEIDAQAGDHSSALAAALSHGQEEVAHLLIDRGANVNDPGERGWTVLGLAAGNGHLGIVRLLLQKGANVNAKSEANKTALQAAYVGAEDEIALLLIEAGAEVSVER